MKKKFWIKAVVKTGGEDWQEKIVESRNLDRAINTMIRCLWYRHCWSNGIIDSRKPTMRLRDFALHVGIFAARPEEFTP